MERICKKCGQALQENDFLCPQCGAIYGEPLYDLPKKPEGQETEPTPAASRREKLWLVVCGVADLVAVLSCVALWNPFQAPPDCPTTSGQPSTAATSSEPTSPVRPTTAPPTTLLPEPSEPVFDPAVLAAEIPEDVLLQMKQTALEQYRLLFYEVEDVTIARAFGIFEDSKYAVMIDDVPQYKWEREEDKEYGMTFLYPDKNAILVYNQGKFDGLWSLSIEEVAVVFENYYNAYPHIPKPEVEPWRPPFDPIAMAAQIPEDMQLQIKQAYVDMTSGEDAADEYRLEAYGIFTDVYAVDFIWLLGGGGSWYGETINGLTFYQVIWIYADGALYSLADAFEQQIISAEELLVIHTNLYN